MELLAGDAEAAEREWREAIRIANEIGAARYVALYRTRIAHVLIAQARDEDALFELEQAREIYGGSPQWIISRARVLARRGETDEAVRLAREAAALSSGSDDITTRAETLVDLAEVLRAHGDLAGAAEALGEAIDLHEEKGNVLPAQRCRDLLATIATPAR
jgi:tetratricopeptide (TPR) repeat protein